MNHFRLVFLVATCALASPLVHAQSESSFGVAGGLTSGFLADDGGYDLEDAAGYHIGAFVDTKFGSLTARWSAFYVRAGTVEDFIFGCSSNGCFERPLGLTFLAFPLDLRYPISLPFLEVYPLVGPELRLPIGELGESQTARAYKASFALNTGLGANIPGSKGFVELRYTLDVRGLSDGVGFTPNDTGNNDERATFKVNALHVRLGFGF